MPAVRFHGVLVPVVTPFTAGGKIDVDRFAALCRDLLADGAGGLAIFGTTSEANSIAAASRMAAMEALVAKGVPAAALMPGAGACSIQEAATLIAHAASVGCGGALMLPPFYYKGVSDEGLFRFFAAVIERSGSPTPLYLYHIPPIAQVGFSLDLIGRLISSFPGIIVGLKDSSGDFENTRAIIQRFPGFDVFAGSEVFLLEALRLGGTGCISATANVNVAGIRAIYDSRDNAGAAAQLQERASLIRRTIQKFSLVPAVKAIVAQKYADPAWKAVLPPLMTLDAASERDLFAGLQAIGFDVQSALASAN